jgi:hypothetical protein
MSLIKKIAQNLAQAIFLSQNFIAEKSISKIRATSVIFIKTIPSKQAPARRKNLPIRSPCPGHKFLRVDFALFLHLSTPRRSRSNQNLIFGQKKSAPQPELHSAKKVESSLR